MNECRKITVNLSTHGIGGRWARKWLILCSLRADLRPYGANLSPLPSSKHQRREYLLGRWCSIVLVDFQRLGKNYNKEPLRCSGGLWWNYYTHIKSLCPLTPTQWTTVWSKKVNGAISICPSFGLFSSCSCQCDSVTVLTKCTMFWQQREPIGVNL